MKDVQVLVRCTEDERLRRGHRRGYAASRGGIVRCRRRWSTLSRPVTDDPLYNDSHYFNFFDHDHGIGAFTRIGKLANRNASIGLFFIYLREGQAFILAQSEHIPRDLKDLRSGPMRYEIIKPLEVLRIVTRAKFLRLENPRDWIDPVGLCPTG